MGGFFGGRAAAPPRVERGRGWDCADVKAVGCLDDQGEFARRVAAARSRGRVVRLGHQLPLGFAGGAEVLVAFPDGGAKLLNLVL